MATTNVTPFQASSYRVVKHVTRQMLKMANDTPYYIKIESPIRQAEQVKNPKKDASGNPIPPPFILDVVNLENGAPSHMVANDVLRSELIKQYKDNGYVGKIFEITKFTKAEGKTYNTFSITELEPVEPEQAKTNSTRR